MPDVSREEYVPLLTVHKCTQHLRYRVHSVQTDTSCKNSRQPARKYVGINQKLTSNFYTWSDQENKNQNQFQPSV